MSPVRGPLSIHLQATPAVIFISPTVPAIAHSAVVATLTDSAGQPVVAAAIDVRVDRGGLTIDSKSFQGHIHGITDADGTFKCWVTADWNRVRVVPGVASVEVTAHVPGEPMATSIVQVTVIGPPASVTIAASPTLVACGETVTVTVTVKDAIGQNVGDGQVVELWTNLGGVLAPSEPVTWGGVATAFLLTSGVHEGPYTILCSAQNRENKTPPVSAQVRRYSSEIA